MILLATNGGVIHLIDAFQGTQLHTFTVSINFAVPAIYSNNKDAYFKTL